MTYLVERLADRRHGLSYADYTEAVRNLRHVPGFSPGMVAALEKLPGFRNVLLHDYVAFSVERGLAALHEIDAVDEFVATVAGIEAGQGE